MTDTRMWDITHKLIEGDPMDPTSTDIIYQSASLRVGTPVPHGWHVLTGKSLSNQIVRVAFRYEIEDGG